MAGKAIGLTDLPEFGAVRLLEAARNLLSLDVATPSGPVHDARSIVESVLQSARRIAPSAACGSAAPEAAGREDAEQLRRAARLIPVAQKNLQHAVIAMMIAADALEARPDVGAPPS